MKTLVDTLNENNDLKKLVLNGKDVMLDNEGNSSNLGYLKQRGAIGSFSTAISNHADYSVYPLNFPVNAKLSSDEVIVLVNTETSRNVQGQTFKTMVKLNLKKGLVYFLDEDSENDPIFEKKGEKLTYVRFYVPSL